MTIDPRAKKSLGQHWLYDPASLKAMCISADVRPGDVVLEVGPGTGSLTAILIENGADVIAVEKDESLVPALIERFDGQKFDIHHESILEFDLRIMPAGYKLVANIPYYLTSNLVRVLSESANPPSVAVMLVQKEVAKRVVAKPGDMSLLSVSAQYYWEVDLGAEVPAHLFTPPPKVDSQILILRRRASQLYPKTDDKQFFKTVKAGFGEKRKTLLNSLSGGLRLSKEEVRAACDKAGIDPGMRAQTLSIDEWHKLYSALNT